MPDLKPLRFTIHAQDAIEERALDIGWVERTVYEPEWSQPDPRRPEVERRFRAIPGFGGRILRVACIETAEEILILTAFFDRDARKAS
jgi:hypothetical protein